MLVLLAAPKAVEYYSKSASPSITAPGPSKPRSLPDPPSLERVISMQTLPFKQVDVFTRSGSWETRWRSLSERKDWQRKRFASSARLNSSEVVAGTRKTARTTAPTTAVGARARDERMTTLPTQVKLPTRVRCRCWPRSGLQICHYERSESANPLRRGGRDSFDDPDWAK